MKETPPMSRKQAQFFAGIIIICTVVAALILVIDYQIKGAIIEQANRLRKEIENFGQKPAATSGHGFAHNSGDDLAYPSDLVRGRTARVEKESASDVDSAEDTAGVSRIVGHNDANGTGKIPDRSE